MPPFRRVAALPWCGTWPGRLGLLAGGNPMPELGPNFFAPTVLADVDHSMQIMREETFGNLRNTPGSVSIAVETGRPVTGHRIITALIGDALRILNSPGTWQPWNSGIMSAVRPNHACG